ncbi:MAG TPA: methylated-DNA--[protein]-cysteine S-methyltransferase [Mariprofundaceae bacterium]|nr:methylated-DNA--[protein]-cysteine S-methyltransferase [Mariprofundaceae bacterium]
MSVETHHFRYRSPVGTIGLELAGDVCIRVMPGKIKAPDCSPDHPVALWLRAYFMGTHLPLPATAAPTSDFQARLRSALREIPCGELRTYGELAQMLNSSPRAVGQALGANPLPILIPCHRVIAANGLGGFSCGLDWKKKLLKLEGAIAPKSS